MSRHSLAIVFALLTLCGCATMAARDPLQVAVAGIEPLQGEGLELRFLVKLRVQNPNGTPVDYDGAYVKLEVQDKTFATGVSDAGGSVSGFGETLVEVPVTVSMLRMARQVIGMKGEAPVEQIRFTGVERQARLAPLQRGRGILDEAARVARSGRRDLRSPEPTLPAPDDKPHPGAAVGKLPQFHVVGFTGHRHLTDPAGAARAIRGALDALRSEGPGEWIALSSIAGGGDQLFVQQARAIGLAWHAILPLPRAEFARDFTPEDWTAVEGMLAAADHVRTISEYGDRKDSYLDCGIETVNGADVLLALWDGEPARGKGGTADVVQYAESIGKPVMIIDAATHEVRKENWTGSSPTTPCSPT